MEIPLNCPTCKKMVSKIIYSRAGTENLTRANPIGAVVKCNDCGLTLSYDFSLKYPFLKDKVFL